MNAILINISGNWGHFKKVDTNNNPLTHDFITKTALIGLIGAVNGIDRQKMKTLFSQLSEDLLYSVSLNANVRKESWGFTLRSVKANVEKSPWQFEFLKSPDFVVLIALKNERSKDIYGEFTENVKANRASFNPTLGLANCPANLLFINSGELSIKKSGSFKTKGFISNRHEIEISESFDFRIGFDKIPTYQNNDFWNDPEKYIGLAYANSGSELKVKSGEYYELTTKNETSQWYLV
ncbi:MAG TPA: CRISPR-associated protein Cas5 [Edaphocola sp.]|nr:CRISPR-associated protein Cas5 [Edaphocola sp.]